MTLTKQVPLTARIVWPRPPLFTVITDPAEWPALDVYDPVPDLDWRTEAAVVVVLGWRPNLGYGVEVAYEETARRQVLITVQESQPNPGSDTAQAIGCPACMVTVPNSESWFTFSVLAPKVR